MKTPSVERLALVFGQRAKRAKVFLTAHPDTLRSVFSDFPFWFDAPNEWQMRMNALDRLGEFHGVETIALGDGSFVDYLNAGDPYVATLYRWRGNYYVGCWGDLVERHGSMDLQDAIARNGYAQH